MLKIKDEVDLKELENFGFHRMYDYYVDNMINLKLAQVVGTYRINCETRYIELFFKEDDLFNKLEDGWYACVLPSEIYDLIKAGLVEEKTEESEEK